MNSSYPYKLSPREVPKWAAEAATCLIEQKCQQEGENQGKRDGVSDLFQECYPQ